MHVLDKHVQLDAFGISVQFLKVNKDSNLPYVLSILYGMRIL